MTGFFRTNAFNVLLAGGLALALAAAWAGPATAEPAKDASAKSTVKRLEKVKREIGVGREKAVELKKIARTIEEELGRIRRDMVAAAGIIQEQERRIAGIEKALGELKAAEKALDLVAAKAGLERTEIGWGIQNVVNENMAGAARVHIAERGRDPRDFALLCTGGAGPVHAYYVARKLGLRKMICPTAAGVASALGLLVAPGRVDRVATVGLRLDTCNLDELEKTYRRLEEDATAMITETGLDPETITFQRLADGRFAGQGFDLVVPLPEGPYGGDGAEAMRDELLASFEAGYREKFSRTPPNVPVEFINIRVSAKAPVSDCEVLLKEIGNGGGSAVKGQRPAYFPEAKEYIETTVYDRSRLTSGASFPGPAIIEEEGSTLIVGPGASVEVSVTGNLIVTMPE